MPLLGALGYKGWERKAKPVKQAEKVRQESKR